MHNTINNLSLIKKEINKINHNINIIAVTKTFKIDVIEPLLKFGHLHYGENKVQESNDKWSGIKSKYKDIQLHMIGKLQSNKVKIAVKLFDYIHSLDSMKLAKKISDEQSKINRNIKIFIQVNIGNEDQKNGILKKDLKDFYANIKKELNLDVIGLMCIPPIDANPEDVFKIMKNLNDELNLKELSMGMSSDYLKAANSGSTFIRIGSKIFGARN
ncbi:YggS family pyridoxal phosphate-dependent enzyme [Candidatus Pelagibacter communis]|uniref:YggS family pyridoxal phosphate-dependent enzyme n=1 Tax=Pelagibacter ubique TaxID=198252 RepID=UPI00094CDA8E|nr:YggS family pyridoxal phosphate-dependent enzyme [Candidatus Pelagibacter ubique]|tara:strand:- start:87 stop:731 length:645 start_codon:yes stop_codon:yes gene_type:complete